MNKGSGIADSGKFLKFMVKIREGYLKKLIVFSVLNFENTSFQTNL